MPFKDETFGIKHEMFDVKRCSENKLVSFDTRWEVAGASIGVGISLETTFETVGTYKVSRGERFHKR